MRFAELCESAGVAPATVKYYLREELLPPGRRESATRADYGPAHLERLRMIRALVDHAGVSIEGVRRVVHALDHPPESRHDLFGAAQEAIDGPAPPVAISSPVRDAVARLGWSACEPWALSHLQAAVDSAAAGGFPVGEDWLVDYGRVLETVGRLDVDGLARDTVDHSPTEALTYVALGTVLTDPVLTALRRLAQQQESRRRYASVPASGSGSAPDAPSI